LTESTREREQKSTMVTAWALNSSILEQFPASAALMRLSAFFGAAPIPFELLHAADASLPEPLLEKLRQLDENPQVLDELLGPLLRLSLVRRSDETRSYSIHPLMQEVVREGLIKEDQKVWAERTIRVVNASFPYVEFEEWSQCDRLLPHALACARLLNSYDLEFAEGGRLLNQVGYYLAERAEYAQAEPLYRQALAIREKVEGRDHPKTAQTLNNLSDLYRKQGRFAEAEPLQQRALAISEKTMGPNHPDIANNLNNLALLYDSQGRHQEAEPLLLRALAIIEKMPVENEYSGLARTLNNLGASYYAQGRYEEAEPLYQRALAICEKALDPGHPDITYTLNNLALLHDHQGRHKEAEPLLRRALSIREKTLGPEHPFTATSLNNLASCLQAQGKWDEASPLFRQALAIVEKMLGSEHPTTVLMRNNLILFYRQQSHAESDALKRNAKEKTE
jgi:tetratricopeptide (TPR) repeat protein